MNEHDDISELKRLTDEAVKNPQSNAQNLNYYCSQALKIIESMNHRNASAEEWTGAIQELEKAREEAFKGLLMADNAVKPEILNALDRKTGKELVDRQTKLNQFISNHWEKIEREALQNATMVLHEELQSYLSDLARAGDDHRVFPSTHGTMQSLEGFIDCLEPDEARRIEMRRFIPRFDVFAGGGSPAEAKLIANLNGFFQNQEIASGSIFQPQKGFLSRQKGTYMPVESIRQKIRERSWDQFFNSPNEDIVKVANGLLERSDIEKHLPPGMNKEKVLNNLQAYVKETKADPTKRDEVQQIKDFAFVCARALLAFEGKPDLSYGTEPLSLSDPSSAKMEMAKNLAAFATSPEARQGMLPMARDAMTECVNNLDDGLNQFTLSRKGVEALKSKSFKAFLDNVEEEHAHSTITQFALLHIASVDNIGQAWEREAETLLSIEIGKALGMSSNLTGMSYGGEIKKRIPAERIALGEKIVRALRENDIQKAQGLITPVLQDITALGRRLPFDGKPFVPVDQFTKARDNIQLFLQQIDPTQFVRETNPVLDAAIEAKTEKIKAEYFSEVETADETEEKLEERKSGLEKQEKELNGKLTNDTNTMGEGDVAQATKDLTQVQEQLAETKNELAQLQEVNAARDLAVPKKNATAEAEAIEEIYQQCIENSLRVREKINASLKSQPKDPWQLLTQMDQVKRSGGVSAAMQLELELELISGHVKNVEISGQYALKDQIAIRSAAKKLSLSITGMGLLDEAEKFYKKKIMSTSSRRFGALFSSQDKVPESPKLEKLGSKERATFSAQLLQTGAPAIAILSAGKDVKEWVLFEIDSKDLPKNVEPGFTIKGSVSAVKNGVGTVKIDAVLGRSLSSSSNTTKRGGKESGKGR
ncbi:MAG: hypothetical protein V4568_19115 [Pseudomonadota bacterium]